MRRLANRRAAEVHKLCERHAAEVSRLELRLVDAAQVQRMVVW